MMMMMMMMNLSHPEPTERGFQLVSVCQSNSTCPLLLSFDLVTILRSWLWHKYCIQYRRVQLYYVTTTTRITKFFESLTRFVRTWSSWLGGGLVCLEVIRCLRADCVDWDPLQHDVFSMNIFIRLQSRLTALLQRSSSSSLFPDSTYLVKCCRIKMLNFSLFFFRKGIEVLLKRCVLRENISMLKAKDQPHSAVYSLHRVWPLIWRLGRCFTHQPWIRHTCVKTVTITALGSGFFHSSIFDATFCVQFVWNIKMLRFFFFCKI